MIMEILEEPSIFFFFDKFNSEADENDENMEDLVFKRGFMAEDEFCDC